jgi:hypothetical protein
VGASLPEMAGTKRPVTEHFMVLLHPFDRHAFRTLADQNSSPLLAIFLVERLLVGCAEADHKEISPDTSFPKKVFPRQFFAS